MGVPAKAIDHVDDMKTCSNCGLALPLSEFYTDKQNSRRVPRGRCKACVKAKQAEYLARPGVREKRLAVHRACRRRPEVMEVARQRAAAWYRTETGKHAHKSWRMKSMYGLTRAEHDAMLLAQGNACAACRKTFPASFTPHIDHNHVTGRARGLLCRECNLVLGHVNDSADRLLALAAYLGRYA